MLQCLLEASDVGGRLLVRIARALACVEPVQPTTDRGEPCPAARALELRKGGCERAMLRSVQRPGDVSRARGEVELVGGAGIRVTQQARAHFRKTREVVEVHPVGRVVLGVVLGPVERRGERRDVDAGDARGEKGPHFGPGRRRCELEAVWKQPVACCAAAELLDPPA